MSRLEKQVAQSGVKVKPRAHDEGALSYAGVCSD